MRNLIALFIAISFAIGGLASCANDIESSNPEEQIPVEVSPRNNIFDFSALFTVYASNFPQKQMPVSIDDEKHFKSVFSATIGRQLSVLRQDEWNIYGSAYNSWKTGALLNPVRYSSRPHIEIDEFFEIGSNLMWRSAEYPSFVEIGHMYRDMINTFYEDEGEFFFDVNDSAIIRSIYKYLTRKGVQFDQDLDYENTQFMRELIIDPAMEYRNQENDVIFGQVRPFENCFTIRDGFSFFTDVVTADQDFELRYQSSVISSVLCRLIEVAIALENENDRVNFLNGLEELYSSNKSWLTNFQSEGAWLSCFESVAVAVYDSAFWREVYGL